MPKIKSFALLLGVLVMSFFVGYLVFGWTEPTAAPPEGNVPAPINVGTTAQTKQGELGATLFRDPDPGCSQSGGSWYVNPSGVSVFCGPVGIGTTNPREQLEITGAIRLPWEPLIKMGDEKFLQAFDNESVFLGELAGDSLLDVDESTGIGALALTNCTYCYWNTAVGAYSLYSNTEGNYNTAIGINALVTNTTGNENTAIGGDALDLNTTGNYNTAAGASALYSNTTASYNSAVGYHALYSNTTGNSNSAMGYYSLYANTTGSHNTAVGREALYANTDGIYNSVMGVGALYSNTSGTRNTAMGLSALPSNTTGSYNTALGYLAGNGNATGDYNIFIGYAASPAANNLTNAIAIGKSATVGQSNAMVLGNTGANALSVGIGTTAPGARLEVVSSAQNTFRLRKTAGTAGSVDLFPAVGDATSRTGTALCQTVVSSAVCLGYWTSAGAASACGTSIASGRALCADFGD